MSSWKKRQVSYEHIHGVTQHDFDTAIAALDLQEGDVVADLMCGYGAMTREALSYARKKEIHIYPVMIDRYKEQLKRASNVDGVKVNEDVRVLTLLDGSVDKAMMKMGLHEIPKNEQQEVISTIYRVLDSGGIFLFWGMIFDTREEQDFFQDIISEKDRLLGHDSFVRERYFSRREEIMRYLQHAGFDDFRVVYEKRHLFNEAYMSEFESDKQREQWTSYVRKHIPEHLKQTVNYQETQKTSLLDFPEGIIKAVK